MRLKDHYKTLEVLPADSVVEIKKKFRRLAMQYHPDVNMADPYAEAKFVEIREAYAILADPVRRRAYDEERWINGITVSAKNQQQVTGNWIMQEATRLRRHMKGIDTYRMDHAALRDYILLLLSDTNVAVLRSEGNNEVLKKVVRELLISTAKLKAAYLPPVTERMMQVADGDPVTMNAVQHVMAERSSQAMWERYFPVIVLLLAIVICWVILMVSH